MPEPSAEWFFVERGQKIGPFTEADIRRAIDVGKVGQDTLVWRPGMQTWMRTRDTELGGDDVPPPVPDVPRVVLDATHVAPDPKMRWCAACRQYVMPQQARMKMGWGAGCAVLVVVLGALFGGLVGLAVAVAVGSLLLVSLVVWVVWESVRVSRTRATCSICKGPL